ncbi:MAG: hypothetical protein AAF743_13580 [Planctomycetota bacterium]
MSEPLEYETPKDRIFESRWPQHWRPVAIVLGVLALPSCLGLGYTSFVFWSSLGLVAGTIAIALGVVDRFTLHPKRRSHNRVYRWPIGLSMVGLVMAGISVVADPILTTRCYETPNRLKCASNLRQIGLELLLYANDNNELPSDMSFITHSAAIDNSCLICRSVWDEHTAAAFGEQAVFGRSSTYVYLGRGLTIFEPAATPLIVEPISNHDGAGGNVLHADGHVDFYTEKEMRLILDDLVAQGRLAPELRDVLLELDR